MNIQQIQAAYLRARLSNGSAFLCIKGKSMYPLFSDGQRVCARYEKPHFGSVVIVETENGSLLVHRVIAVLGGRMVTKGDNNMNHDRIIYSQDIIGIVKMPKHGIRNIAIGFFSLIEAIINMTLYALIRKRWIGLHYLLISAYSFFIKKNTEPQ